MTPSAQLEQRLGFEFEDHELFETSLTHRSFAAENGVDDNERLELLGDAVVELVVVDHLYCTTDQEREGELSKLKARLVSRAALAELARHYRLGDEARLGVGEKKSGGAEKTSVLANIMEAVLGAVYLEGGLAAAARVAAPLFELALPEPDFKGRLQERLQSTGHPPPIYRLAGTSGPDHEKTFAVECRIGGEVAGVGEAGSKKQAEQHAAAAALQALD